jgi:hypothetical protein
VTFVRYRSPHPNARGARIGIFALANGLRARGELSAEELGWLRENNAWYDAAYAEPDPGVFDRTVNPVTECWFKDDAVELLARVDGYLALLDAHGIAWEVVRSDGPGRVIYEDSLQVVVTVAPDERAIPRP